MNFIERLESTLQGEFNVSVTENMALGYKTTGKSLLDLNFALASLRGRSEQEITDMARDVRGGLGERRLFRVIFEYLARNNEEVPVGKLIGLIPEYGRYDDLLKPNISLTS